MSSALERAPRAGNGRAPEGERRDALALSAAALGLGTAAGEQQDLDVPWLMVFLNILLVMFAGFLIISAVREMNKDQARQALRKGGGLAAERAKTAAASHAEHKGQAEAVKRKLSELKLKGAVVDLHEGHPRIMLSSGVLFESGKAEIAPGARARLEEVAAVLRPLKSQILVEGHTDDRPIRSARFPSNWELSAARALAVVKLLMASGIDPEQLKFVGYGEHRPRHPNDTEEHRSLNRRIEIKVR